MAATRHTRGDGGALNAALLRGLGWFATANDLEAGRGDRDAVRRKLAEAIDLKRSFLASHGYVPGTAGEEMHERVSGWCDRAEAILGLPEGKQGGEGS